MKFSELPDHPDVGVVLYCQGCGEIFSAAQADYFTANPAEDIPCGECGSTKMVLARREVRFVPITPEQAETLH